MACRPTGYFVDDFVVFGLSTIDSVTIGFVDDDHFFLFFEEDGAPLLDFLSDFGDCAPKRTDSNFFSVFELLGTPFVDIASCK